MKASLRGNPEDPEEKPQPKPKGRPRKPEQATNTEDKPKTEIAGHGAAEVDVGNKNEKSQTADNNVEKPKQECNPKPKAPSRRTRKKQSAGLGEATPVAAASEATPAAAASDQPESKTEAAPAEDRAEDSSQEGAKRKAAQPKETEPSPNKRPPKAAKSRGPGPDIDKVKADWAEQVRCGVMFPNPVVFSSMFGTRNICYVFSSGTIVESGWDPYP